MKNTKSFSELEKFEWYDVALSNAKTNPEMSESLNQIGVSAEVLEEGRNLHNVAKKAYRDAYAAKKNRIEAYKSFYKKSEMLYEYFNIDRKKAQIAFLSDTLAKNKIDLNRPVQQNRLKQFDMSKTFYTVLSENPDLLEPLAKLGVRAEDVTAKLELISEIEKSRANYMLEKGLSQNATNVKSKAINKLSKWMTQFFSISRNAFKDNPQLMEAFGFVVKN